MSLDARLFCLCEQEDKDWLKLPDREDVSYDTVLIWQGAAKFTTCAIAFPCHNLWDLCFAVTHPLYKVLFLLPSLPHCLCISSVSLGAILSSVVCRLSLGCVTLDLLFWEWVSSDFTYFRLLWNPADPCETASQSELAVRHLDNFMLSIYSVFFPLTEKGKFSFSYKSTCGED